MSIEETAVQIVVTAEVITVASIDENGYPRPVAMVKLKDENGGSYKTPLWSDWMLFSRRSRRLGILCLEIHSGIVYLLD